MNASIPSADDFLDEMDRTRRSDRRRRIFYSVIFWLLVVYLSLISAYYIGLVPIRVGIAVLIIGIIVTVVREVLASRKYRMPDEYYDRDSIQEGDVTE